MILRRREGYFAECDKCGKRSRLLPTGIETAPEALVTVTCLGWRISWPSGGELNARTFCPDCRKTEE